MTKVNIFDGIETEMEPPYVADEDVEREIAGEQYYVFPGTTVTVCCLTCKNGGYVIGQSMCINPKNFNALIGRTASRKVAKSHMYPMIGYAILEGMRPKALIPDQGYAEPKITSENVGDIRWIDGGADLVQTVEIIDYLSLADLKAGI